MKEIYTKLEALSLNELRDLRSWLDTELIPAKNAEHQRVAVVAMAIEDMRGQGILPEPSVWRQPSNQYEGYIAGDVVEHEGVRYRCQGVDLTTANPETGDGWAPVEE